jgi:hypothetical protein
LQTDTTVFQNTEVGEHMFKKSSVKRIGGIIFAGFTLSACADIGPQSVGNDRLKYNEVLQNTNNEELLLNLVRLRYHDTPSFVNVSSITAQLSLSTSATLGLTNTRTTESSTLGNNALARALSSTFTYAQNPVISYSPLHGDAFVREMLTPISLDLFVLLAQSGWDLEKILKLGVTRLNLVPNAPSGSGPTPRKAPEYKNFHKLVKALKAMGPDVHINYFVRDKKNVPGIHFSPGALKSPEGKTVVELLNLHPATHTYALTLSESEENRPQKTISVRTRSLLGILYFLSHSVDVPPQDFERGLVVKTQTPDGQTFDWKEISKEMFRINVEPKRPEKAAVVVQYRGHWFSIRDNDLETKATFTLLSQLLSLQSGNSIVKAPALTIPLN